MNQPLLRPPTGRIAVTIDVAIVLAVTAITEWNAWVFGTVPGPRALTTALPLLLALPLLWRRKRPLLVVALVMAGVLAQAVASGNSAVVRG